MALLTGASWSLSAGTANEAHRFSIMHMLLEKTIFKADVLELTIAFDPETQTRLQEQVTGHQYSDQLADEIAETVYRAPHVRATMLFLRSIGFRRFLDEIGKSVQCAHESHTIDRGEYERVISHLRMWFSSLSNRGIQKGDRLIYFAGPDSLHTVFITHDGRVLVNQTERMASARMSLLGGYFAPCSEFREPLIRSLFERR